MAKTKTKTKKSHLSKAETTEIRRLLQKLLDRVARSIDGQDLTAASIMESKATEDDMGKVEAVGHQEMLSTLVERDRTRIGQLMRALERLDKGVFGVCTRCEGTIAFERLEVLPEADACRDCALGLQ